MHRRLSDVFICHCGHAQSLKIPSKSLDCLQTMLSRSTMSQTCALVWRKSVQKPKAEVKWYTKKRSWTCGVKQWKSPFIAPQVSSRSNGSPIPSTIWLLTHFSYSLSNRKPLRESPKRCMASHVKSAHFRNPLAWGKANAHTDEALHEPNRTFGDFTLTYGSRLTMPSQGWSSSIDFDMSGFCISS